ncbi:MAG: HD domain-containing protein [Thermomicrobiales bacterium]
MEVLRQGVRESLSELDDITDADLRNKVVEAHTLALSRTEFARIEQMRPSGGYDTPAMRRGTQADHFRGVARMAVALADGLEAVMGPIGIDRDILLAGALCHDVGKAYEFSPRNLARWQADPAAAGFPAVRHPAYGAHLALTVGLPEAIVHIAGAHSMNAEGAYVKPSLENVIVQYADVVFWRILERANLMEQ